MAWLPGGGALFRKVIEAMTAEWKKERELDTRSPTVPSSNATATQGRRNGNRGEPNRPNELLHVPSLSSVYSNLSPAQGDEDDRRSSFSTSCTKSSSATGASPLLDTPALSSTSSVSSPPTPMRALALDTGREDEGGQKDVFGVANKALPCRGEERYDQKKQGKEGVTESSSAPSVAGMVDGYLGADQVGHAVFGDHVEEKGERDRSYKALENPFDVFDDDVQNEPHQIGCGIEDGAKEVIGSPPSSDNRASSFHGYHHALHSDDGAPGSRCEEKEVEKEIEKKEDIEKEDIEKKEDNDKDVSKPRKKIYSIFDAYYENQHELGTGACDDDVPDKEVKEKPISIFDIPHPEPAERPISIFDLPLPGSVPHYVVHTCNQLGLSFQDHPLAAPTADTGLPPSFAADREETLAFRLYAATLAKYEREKDQMIKVARINPPVYPLALPPVAGVQGLGINGIRPGMIRPSPIARPKAHNIDTASNSSVPHSSRSLPVHERAGVGNLFECLDLERFEHFHMSITRDEMQELGVDARTVNLINGVRVINGIRVNVRR